MTDTMMETAPGQALARKIATDDLATVLLARADAEGVSLVGPGGLLGGLTKSVLEAGLETELDEHLGYGPYDPAGHNSGNSRNGTRSKTVLTEIKNRGTKDVCIVVCDGLKGLPEAVNTVWGEAIVQTCVVHYADVRVMPTLVAGLLWGKGFVLERSA